MSELTDLREAKDHHFCHDHHSPLTSEQQTGFAGLAYFPENTALQLELLSKNFRTRKKRRYR